MYGFQGQETDVEYLNSAVAFKYRIHDPRIGRFLSLDPLSWDYPWNSPYAYSENRVIDGGDLEGLEFAGKIVKAATKASLKKATKEFVEVGVKERLQAYTSKKWASKLIDDAMTIEGILNDPWYVIAAEWIPFYIGDGVAIANWSYKGYKVYDAIKDIEKRVEGILSAIKRAGKNKSGLSVFRGRTYNKFGLDVTDMPKVNGRYPINGRKYAGGTAELSGDLGKKYKDGVKFSEDGFPDFTPYAHKVDGKTVHIQVGLNGTSADIREAKNKYEKAFGKVPENHTFHHLENSNEVILVPTDLHEAVRHTGGNATGKP